MNRLQRHLFNTFSSKLKGLASFKAATDTISFS